MTDLQLHSHPLRVFEDVDGEPREVEIPTPLQAFFSSDRVRLRFTGTLPPVPHLHLSNFIESVLDHFQAEDVDFSLCDFKDSAIRHSRFRRCKIDNNSFLMNIVADTLFEDCTFYNFSSQGSEFRRVKFVSCNLTNTLIKSAKFIECEFVDCVTSNKVIEMSMVTDTKFVRTEIQIDTITSNFGITAADLTESLIRDGRARDPHQSLTPAELLARELPNLSTLERLRLEWFAEPDLTDGSDALDRSVAIDQWARIYKSPASVADLFELFAEFLIFAFERDRITVQPLLKLHAVTAQLTAQSAVSRDYQRIAVAVGGVHLLLSRIVERYLHVVDDASAVCGTRVKMLVDGPLDAHYYTEMLAPWLSLGRVMITRLVPHNSPAEITFEAAKAVWLLPLLGVFFATRTSVQIFRLEEDLQARRGATALLPGDGTSEALVPVRRAASKKELLRVTSGHRRKKNEYQIHVRAVLSTTLLVDMKLNIGTKFAGKLRKVLRVILVD